MSVAMFMVMTSAGRPSMTARACLLEPPWDILICSGFAAFRLPVFLEGGVVILAEVAHHVAGRR